jgi:hypothetical protein
VSTVTVRPSTSDDEIKASMVAAAQMWEIERRQVASPEVENPGVDPRR